MHYEAHVQAIIEFYVQYRSMKVKKEEARTMNLTPRCLRRRRYLPHTPLVRRRRSRSRSRRGRGQGMPSPRSGCEVPRPSRGVRYLSIDAR